MARWFCKSFAFFPTLQTMKEKKPVMLEIVAIKYLKYLSFRQLAPIFFHDEQIFKNWWTTVHPILIFNESCKYCYNNHVLRFIMYIQAKTSVKNIHFKMAETINTFSCSR